MTAVKVVLHTCLVLSVLYTLTLSDNLYSNCKNCSYNVHSTVFVRNNGICLKSKHWYLHRNLSTWRFAPEQILFKTFPVDKERRIYVREVKGCLFSIVYPQPLKRGPKLAAVNVDVLIKVLDMDPTLVDSGDFLEFVSGNTILQGTMPLSHRYGGHQFGYWSDQLGDGRAVMLGEYVNSHGERWELQLKGSGLTPYSRQGDGRAVIRSSVREFLCSEAMHALGIPTSRAVSLVVSSDPVIRDQFYNGNVKKERAAVVLRLAQSWFRIGSLEILAVKKEIKNLRNLTNFIIQHYFPFINKTDPDRVLSFYQEVVTQTAHLIAQWQGVGFTHGVCNTDNFSILSITIDYGPFGFMEKYNPKFVPNTSDDEGRYSYENQPDVGSFNLRKLKEALHPLLDKKQKRTADNILKSYTGVYKSKFMEIFLKKLGFDIPTRDKEDVEQFLAILFKIMDDTDADFTMTFRELSEISLQNLSDSISNDNFQSRYWTLPILSNHEWFQDWVSIYIKYIEEDGITDEQRQSKMLKINPRYILRNWIAQSAIERAEHDDFSELDQVSRVLASPFDYNEIAEQAGFASRPPAWSKQLRVSCSS